MNSKQTLPFCALTLLMMTGCARQISDARLDDAQTDQRQITFDTRFLLVAKDIEQPRLTAGQDHCLGDHSLQLTYHNPKSNSSLTVRVTDYNLDNRIGLNEIDSYHFCRYDAIRKIVHNSIYADHKWIRFETSPDHPLAFMANTYRSKTEALAMPSMIVYTTFYQKSSITGPV